MKRTVVNINEALCDGCGQCIPNCHEGALQMIDGKARLISDLFCDGLGACIGHCPQGAISMEEREAQPYDEVEVMKQMIHKGNNTIIAHLDHLLDHGELGYFSEGVNYLQQENFELKVPSTKDKLIKALNEQGMEKKTEEQAAPMACGCPGSLAREMNKQPVDTKPEENTDPVEVQSELQNWPVQMHLINPAAGYFKDADLLVAADCTAFSLGGFHSSIMKGKKVVIACPKLDDGKDRYIQKFTSLIDDARVNTITAAIMEVPCCSGLIQLLEMARQQAERNVPIKKIVIGVEGNIITEDWI